MKLSVKITRIVSEVLFWIKALGVIGITTCLLLAVIVLAIIGAFIVVLNGVVGGIDEWLKPIGYVVGTIVALIVPSIYFLFTMIISIKNTIKFWNCDINSISKAKKNMIIDNLIKLIPAVIETLIAVLLFFCMIIGVTIGGELLVIVVLWGISNVALCIGIIVNMVTLLSWKKGSESTNLRRIEGMEFSVRK